MIDSTQEEVDARKEASEKPFERACTNCGNGEYSEGIDFDEVTFCRSCCEKAGVGKKTETLKSTAYPETLEAEVYNDYEVLREKIRKEVLDELLNQPANQHDNLVREDEREKIKI